MRKINPTAFIREFEKTLDVPHKKPRKPIILAVAGPSRVGKTTVLRCISQKLPYFVRIANDDMRLLLYVRGFPDSPTVESFLYRSAPSVWLAEKYLKRGYSVMLDDNFASNPIKLKHHKELMSKFDTKFFVIRVWAPARVVRHRLRGTNSKLFPDWRVGLAHFERSRKQFDYKHIGVPYLACVNTARPLASQLRRAIAALKEAMELNK